MTGVVISHDSKASAVSCSGLTQSIFACRPGSPYPLRTMFLSGFSRERKEKAMTTFKVTSPDTWMGRRGKPRNATLMGRSGNSGHNFDGRMNGKDHVELRDCD